MTTIKNKIKNEEHTDWVICTLGLHKTSTALHDYVKNKIFKYTHSSLQNLQNLFTPAEFNHINLGASCIRKDLLSRLTEKKDRRGKHKWEWKDNCQKCRDAFQKILILHTGKSRLHLENCDDTSIIPLEWAIAKMFMPQGNKDNNKGPEDTDPAALLILMLNCDLFKYSIRKAHKTKLIEARNSLHHSPDNKVKAGDKAEYFHHMELLLEDASVDNDVDQIIRDTIVEDIKEIKKLKDSEISMTLYDDALKIKRKGIHNDFERCLSKIESEGNMEQLRKLLDLAEKAGADIQELNDELEKTKHYKEGIERIKIKLTNLREATKDVSKEVRRDLEKFQRVELQKVIDKVTCQRETLENENENRKQIIDDFNLIIVVIVVGAVFFALMFRSWTLNHNE